MSQAAFGNLSSPTSGTTLIDTKLEPAFDALLSMHSGTSRPSYAVAGIQWLDTTTTPWVLKFFDGTNDISLGTINASTHVFTPANAGMLASTYDPANIAQQVLGLTAVQTGISNKSFVAPALGVATATSINFGQDALNYYDEGTWTPVDGSGAGLSFTTNSGTYTRIGDRVFFDCVLTYPSTASGTTAAIQGLPFVPAISASANIGYRGAGTTTNALVNASTGKISLYVNAAVATNANNSTAQLYLSGSYRI